MLLPKPFKTILHKRLMPDSRMKVPEVERLGEGRATTNLRAEEAAFDAKLQTGRTLQRRRL